MFKIKKTFRLQYFTYPCYLWIKILYFVCFVDIYLFSQFLWISFFF